MLETHKRPSEHWICNPGVADSITAESKKERKKKINKRDIHTKYKI